MSHVAIFAIGLIVAAYEWYLLRKCEAVHRELGAHFFEELLVEVGDVVELAEAAKSHERSSEDVVGGCKKLRADVTDIARLLRLLDDREPIAYMTALLAFFDRPEAVRRYRSVLVILLEHLKRRRGREWKKVREIMESMLSIKDAGRGE